jgi:hypothetical protein
MLEWIFIQGHFSRFEKCIFLFDIVTLQKSMSSKGQIDLEVLLLKFIDFIHFFNCKRNEGVMVTSLK